MRSRPQSVLRVLYFAAGVLLLAPSGTLSLAGAGAAALGLSRGIADHAEGQCGMNRGVIRRNERKEIRPWQRNDAHHDFDRPPRHGSSAPESFHRGMDSGPDYLVADGGSSDPGPVYLGEDICMGHFAEEEVELFLTASRRARGPAHHRLGRGHRQQQPGAPVRGHGAANCRAAPHPEIQGGLFLLGGRPRLPAPQAAVGAAVCGAGRISGPDRR